MPTQRPFLSNFLAAFRAHSHPLFKSQSSLSSSGAVVATTQSIWTSSQSVSTSPSPQAKAHSQSPTTSAPQDISSVRSKQVKTSAQVVPHSFEKREYHPLQHTVSPTTHLPRTPSSPGLPAYATNKSTTSYPTCQEARPSRRRSSDSSSEGGFREVKGPGWYVGGRTGSGEDKYYKLSMARRERSADRISADQLSL